MTETITDRGMTTTRRTLVRGAAWSVPVVAAATAAPAYAASPCDSLAGTVDWGNTGRYVRSGATSATYTIPDPDGSGPGQPLTLTVSVVETGSNVQLGSQLGVNDNLRTDTGVGGSSNTVASLTLHQSPVRDGNKVNTWTTSSNRSITRFTFSRPVTNLVFTLRDIDSAARDFLDAIAIVGASFTPTIANPTLITGNGSTGNPLRSAGANAPVDNSSADGNVTISMPSATSFDVYYWNLSDTSSNQIDGDQKVFISGLSFGWKPC